MYFITYIDFFFVFAVSDIDLQFALKDSDVYRTATYDNLPIRLKYLPKMIYLFIRMFIYPRIYSDGVDYAKIAEKFDHNSFKVGWNALYETYWIYVQKEP